MFIQQIQATLTVQRLRVQEVGYKIHWVIMYPVGIHGLLLLFGTVYLLILQLAC
jgi:hypothetical protein